MKLVAITPVYRNAATLEALADRMRRAAEALYDEFEHIFVDDGSPDQSFEVLARLAAANPHVRVIRLTRNFGQHAAMLAGLEIADGDHILFIDADLEEEPEQLEAFTRAITGGAEIAVGVRGSRDRPVQKRLPARIYTIINHALTDYPVINNATNMRLFTRRYRDHLRAFRERPFFGGFTAWIGLPVATVPVHYRASHRDSSYTLRRMLRHARIGILGFSTKLLRWSTIAGFLISGGCVLYAVWLLGIYVLRGQSAPGFLTLALLVSFLIGVQCVFIGILGEYLGEVFESVKGRPRYLVRETLNIERPR